MYLGFRSDGDHIYMLLVALFYHQAITRYGNPSFAQCHGSSCDHSIYHIFRQASTLHVFQTRLLVFLAKSVAKQGKRQPFCSKKFKYSPKLSGRLRSRSSVNNSKLASLESKRQGSRINREKNVTFSEEALHTRLV